MTILLLGSGGREHAIAHTLSKDSNCARLFIAPGNAGTAQCGTNLPIAVNDFEAIKQAVLAYQIEMVIVGPEEPLVRGIVDFFKKDNDLSKISVIGPSATGAQLEGSKAFAKKFMARYKIPTAAYREVASLTEGVAFLKTLSPPYVLKADGLAAGKGVLILNDLTEATHALQNMLDGQFGDASRRVVIEAFLSGIEFSVFVVTDGKSYKILPEAKDYKRIGEGDTGLNTGGMGAVSPVPFVDDALWHKVEERIIRPTITGLAAENIDYKGFIFFGLINVKGEPYVIEYNCRMGDPETEVVVPRLKNSLVTLFKSLTDGNLEAIKIDIDPRTATTVMLVAGGYPGDYQKGDVITQIPSSTEGGSSIVFHAGTTVANGQIVTNGGRVMAITSFGSTIQEAIQQSNTVAALIDFKGKYYRKDIGLDLIAPLNIENEMLLPS